MANKYVLDTHALVWYLEGNRKLGSQARITMEAADSLLVLPLIVLVEATYLIQRGRIGIPAVADLLADVRDDSRIEVFPLNWDVFERSLSTEALRIPESHDRLIVSTALLLHDLGDNVGIITRDQSIVQAGVLPIIW